MKIRGLNRKIGVYVGEVERWPRTLSPQLAFLVGLNESLVLSQLLTYRAYHGPGGDGWMDITDSDWMRSMPFMPLECVHCSLDSLIEQQYIFIDVNFSCWMEYPDDIDNLEIDYLINPEHLFRKDERERNRSGYVYLLAGNGLYKIGRTKEVEQRHHQINRNLPFHVDVVASIYNEDASGTESLWHSVFKNKRVKGEWFDLTPEDIALFCSSGRVYRKDYFPLDQNTIDILHEFDNADSEARENYIARLQAP